MAGKNRLMNFFFFLNEIAKFCKIENRLAILASRAEVARENSFAL